MQQRVGVNGLRSVFRRMLELLLQHHQHVLPREHAIRGLRVELADHVVQIAFQLSPEASRHAMLGIISNILLLVLLKASSNIRQLLLRRLFPEGGGVTL